MIIKSLSMTLFGSHIKDQEWSDRYEYNIQVPYIM